MPEKIAVVGEKLKNLTGGEKNSILNALEEELAKTTDKLEVATTILGEAAAKLNELKTLYEEAKSLAPSFKKTIKPLVSGDSAKIAQIIPIGHDFTKIVPEVEAAIDEFLKSKLAEIENYKNQVNSKEANISDLAAELKTVQTKLNTQRALVEQLKLAMEDNNLSKSQAIDLLRKFIDEKGEPLFSEEELVIACLLVMFGDSIDLEQKDGVPMSRVLADAFSQADSEPVEEVTNTNSIPLIVEEQAPIVPLEVPIVVENNVIDFANAKKKKTKNKPTIKPVIEKIETAKVIPFPTMEREAKELVDATKELELVAFDDPYDLIAAEYENRETSDSSFTKKIISYTPEEEARYAENIKIIEALGLKGDPKKNPITFYKVTPKEVEEMIELASSYGIKLRTIEDLAILCRTKKVESLLNQGTEKSPEGLGSKSVSHIIVAADVFGKGAKSTNHALKEYLSNNAVFEALEDVVDNVKLGSAGYINLINLLGMLDDVLEKNAYAYIVNGRLFSKKRVESVLTKLLASDIKATDEELLLIALTYDSQLGSSEEIALLDNELHARLNADRGRVLGGMAA